MQTHPNVLLARLSKPDFSAIQPHLSVFSMERGQTLVDAHETIHRVTFPHDGVLSLVVELPGGTPSKQALSVVMGVLAPGPP